MKCSKIALTGIFVIIITYLLIFSFSFNKNKENADELLINDVSRLNPTHINKIVKNDEVKGLQTSLEEARKNNLKVSIAGKRHSMGGHTFYKDALVLDMTSFNKTLKIDKENKIATVQSGATWENIINHINKEGFSIQVMQAYNTFTLGGSMSVNVHESDPNYGSMIETIKSFRLLLANGSIVNVSRTENPELFSLVIGGYGLFGVILDADIYLEDNHIYKKKEYVINYSDYYEFFKKLREDSNIIIIFARLSISNDESLLKELIVTTYEIIENPNQDYNNLAETKNTGLKKFIFGLSRKYDFGKKLRWNLQKKYSNKFEPEIVSRNNLMNNNIDFLNYYSSRNTDILQEYFVPVENLTLFLNELKNVVEENDLNLLSATIRYIPKNEESVLSYSTKESYGIVLYFNIGLSDKEQKIVERWTQELINIAIKYDGTFYLPYQLYASNDQVRKAYHNFNKFIEKKKEYDPQELFMSKFYEKYEWEF